MSIFGTLADYTTGTPLRPATRDEWEMTAAALASGEAGGETGAWRDGDINDGHPVYVAGGPEADVTSSDIRELRDEAGSAGDAAQAELCDRALNGDDDARSECVRIILDTRIRAAEDDADA